MKQNARIALVSLSICLLAGSALAQDQPGRPNQRNRGRQPEVNALKVGQMAPTFTLASLDGKDKFELKSYRNERPVILFYGSYT